MRLVPLAQPARQVQPVQQVQQARAARRVRQVQVVRQGRPVRKDFAVSKVFLVAMEISALPVQVVHQGRPVRKVSQGQQDHPDRQVLQVPTVNLVQVARPEPLVNPVLKALQVEQHSKCGLQMALLQST